MGRARIVRTFAAATATAAVLTAGAPLALRAPLLTIGAAAYGLALAWAGVQIAATTGTSKMPELCQVALASKV